MAKYWEQHKKNYRKKSLNEAKIHKQEVEKDKKYYERYYRRIYCAHCFNTEATALGIQINNPKAVMAKAIELIMKKQRKKDFLEYLMAYLYVYCTPFMSYREYSCAMKSHFRKSGNQMSGKWKSSCASLLA